DIAECESYLLEEMKFYLVVYHPYQVLIDINQQIKLAKPSLQAAWSIINDSFRTDLILVYPPHVIALASLFLSRVVDQGDLSELEAQQWFADLNVDVTDILQAVNDLIALYGIWKSYVESKMPNLVSGFISELAAVFQLEMDAYEESGFPEIKAIFLAQFHTDLGPIVRLSYPEDAVEVGEQKSFAEISSNKSDEYQHHQYQRPSDSVANREIRGFSSYNGEEAPVEVIQLIKRPVAAAIKPESNRIDFNSIQTLVIPKLTLFERLITVHTGKYKVMCYPVAVEGNYVRNALIFNMCFAFGIDADTKCYEPVVKRVGCLLKELEIGGRLLSDPEGQRPLKTMMRQLVTKLNAHGEYQIELDLKGLSQSMVSTGISIRLFPHHDNPSEINLYDVPVRKMDFEAARTKSSSSEFQSKVANEAVWDMVLDKVIHCIDNVNHVRRIARLAQIQEDWVILALKHLDYFGCINLVDIFQFGNIYESQHQMMGLYRSARLQRECFSYVTRDGKAGDIAMDALIQMYLTMRNRQTVAQWIVEQKLDLDRFDVRRFIMFGVMHRLLRRIHCYPVICGPPSLHSEEESDSSTAGANGIKTFETKAKTEVEAVRVVAETGTSTEESRSQSQRPAQVAPIPSVPKTLDSQFLHMLDGTHHMDEISVLLDKDIATLKDIFSDYGGIEYVYH
ncbi:Nitrogen permease regulator 2, partial [Coemansia asiatica]